MNGRDKGKRGEREFFNLMNELLGEQDAFVRNLTQTRGGGEDWDTQYPVAVEVKRQENLPYPAAIRQTKEQAAKAGKIPVLAHKRNREDWNVLLVLTPYQFARVLKGIGCLNCLAAAIDGGSNVCGHCGSTY